jgi:membrane-associated phospholipid phosphatase
VINRFNLNEPDARRAIRRLFAAYLFISGIALAFPYRPAAWPVVAVLHALGIIVLLQTGPTPSILAWLQARFPRATRIIGDWYAIAIIPVMYTELALLNSAVWNGRYFDTGIIAWEEKLFGGHPFKELAAAFPNLALSEFLHFAYLSYYFIIYAPAFYLYLRGRRAEHQQLVFALLLAFFAHYVFFVYFPVQGPRYLYPAPGGEIARGWFYNLAHQVLEAGSARGSAFPSSHVGVSIMATAFAFAAIPRIAPLLLILTLGLAFGAVYGGFHYATDAALGFIYGLILFACAPRIARALAGMRRTR